MKKLLTLFTRTPLHVGSGSSVGAVDLPIQRERHTRIPVIPGTSLKGVLADLWSSDLDKETRYRKKNTDLVKLFGYAPPPGGDDKESFAGALLIGEARLIAFPIRSARGAFAWLTCPLVLRRLSRDRGVELPANSLPTINDDECLAGSSILLVSGQEKKAIFEEYCFSGKEGVKPLAEYLKNLCDDQVWSSLAERLAMVSDGIFSYFVENACETVTRIRIDDRTGTVAGGALFTQEQVPSEALFAALIEARDVKASSIKAGDALSALATRLESAGKLIQVGGDETTGLGLCSVKLLDS